jgi:small subunit ribosomal protein S5
VRAEQDNRFGDVSEVVVDTRRVTKVVKGGSRLAFSVLLLAGNKKGRVGFAVCKDREVINARMKAAKSAKRALTFVPLKESRTLHHDVYGKHGATRVLLRSARPGSGIVAGGVLRPFFELLGVKDIRAKIIGSCCPHNVVRAAMNALSEVDTPRAVAARLSRGVEEIIARRNRA